MAKRVATQQNQELVTELIISKNEFKSQLSERIDIGSEIHKRLIQIDAERIQQRKDYFVWSDYNLEFLKQSFSKELNEYRKEYDNAGEWSGPLIRTVSIFGETQRISPQQEHQNFLNKLNSKIENLRRLLNKTELLKSLIVDIPISSKNKELNFSQIFIVHGQDDLAKIEVARFVEKLGFKPIILHEQASSGKTIIEKIEDYSNVGFGIVIYTPCDTGYKNGDESNKKSRARQNVVFEHGYLIGKIGRGNVCALVKGDLEIPNDISGIVYVSMKGSWQLELAKELRNCGYVVDMNLVI